MSTITKEELSSVQTDPIAAVALMFNKLDEADSDVMNIDPSNPFAFTMETIAFNAAVLRDEINTKYSRLFTRLANDDSDLFTNIAYTDYKNIFSQPANATVRFFINVTDFETNAVAEDEYKMVTIPELSVLSVEGFNFLITNAIDIKQFKNGSFSIEQRVSTLDIGVGVLGVLPYTIITNEDSNRILIFDTILKQITLQTKSYTINKTDTYKDIIYLKDRLHYITAYTTNGNVVTDVDVSYSEVIDPNRPTIIISILRGGIEIKVPDVYILNNGIRGKLYVNIFTTQGEVDYPLDKIPHKEFKLVYNNTTENKYTAAINNINIANTSLHRLSGGTNGKSFEDLRESIIANSIGDVDQPITKSQIIDVLSRSGYYSYLLEDSVTNRLFIASKALPITDVKKELNASPDMLYYKTRIVKGDYINHPFIKVSDDIDDRLIVKPYTLFKNKNGIIEPLSVNELNILNGMNDKTLISYLNNNDILYSPYSYISSIDNEVYSLRVVEFTPKIDSFNIKAINNNTLYKANIKKHSIVSTTNGYRIGIELSTNSEFDTIDPSLVKGQLRVKIFGTEDIYVYFYSNFVDGKFQFNIDTDFYVDSDSSILLTNGISDLSTKVIGLSDAIELITYVDRPGSELESSNYINTLVKSDTPVVALTLEELDVTFGTLIEDIHKNLSIGYTNRKYLTYDEDVYATYAEDVYDVDDIGSMLEANYTHTEVIYTKLHAKGDPILDENGNPIILHKKGSYKLDENNNPRINLLEGVVKYTDMVMLEYFDYLANNKNDDTVVTTIAAYLRDMNEYKDIILEETNLRFKPFRNSENIKIKLNRTFALVYKPIRPEVELFIESNTKISNDNPLELQTIIGAIIHKTINSDVFYISDIKEEIMETVAIDISAIRIDLDRNDNSPLSGLEKVSLYDNTNRLRIQKKVVNSLGYLSSTYDVLVKITRI